MVKVCFIILDEKRTLQLQGSTSTNPGISDVPSVPPVGFEITDAKTGVTYRVVNVEDVRQGSPGPSFLDYMAELERLTMSSAPVKESKLPPGLLEAGARAG